MQPAQVEKPPLELSKPEEKLLRAPTFFEKYAWIKPVSILTILIATIILSSYLLQANNPIPNTTSTSPSPNTINTNAVWKTYVSNEGKFSLKYPPAYTLSENTTSNTTQIYSNTIPGTKTNFKFIITYKPSNNQTLQQLINENKICPDISSIKGTPSVINGNEKAQIYLDTPCGSYPTTIVYTINNETLYIITVETQSKFSEIKQYTDQIFSSLKFLDDTKITPKLSCRPRPACLDNVPRCMIPETPDMCPSEKKICGGIAGLQCPNGYQCKLDSNYPDASGLCVKNDLKITPGQKACPADAKQCPDGSWVGRTGPNCEFICPQPKNSSALKNACQEKGGTWLDKYQECESTPTDKGLDQTACTALGGTFNACDSACRHNNNPQQGCILVCVKTCKLN